MPLALVISMNTLREYTRIFVVYMSFVAFAASEVAVIFLVYRYLGII